MSATPAGRGRNPPRPRGTYAGVLQDEGDETQPTSGSGDVRGEATALLRSIKTTVKAHPPASPGAKEVSVRLSSLMDTVLDDESDAAALTEAKETLNALYNQINNGELDFTVALPSSPSPSDQNEQRSVNSNNSGMSDISAQSVIISAVDLMKQSIYHPDFEHIIPGIDGSPDKRIKQSHVDEVAERENKHDPSKMLSNALKRLNVKDCTYKLDRSYTQQMRIYDESFACSLATPIRIHTSAVTPYKTYLSWALSTAVYHDDTSYLMTPVMYRSITSAMSSALDTYVGNDKNNQILNQFRSIHPHRHEDSGLKKKLDILISQSLEHGTLKTDEERMALFRELRFREDSAVLRGSSEHKSHAGEWACTYLARLIDSQLELNQGSPEDSPVISNSEVVSTFRQQITGRGVGLTTAHARNVGSTRVQRGLNSTRRRVLRR